MVKEIALLKVEKGDQMWMQKAQKATHAWMWHLGCNCKHCGGLQMKSESDGRGGCASTRVCSVWATTARRATGLVGGAGGSITFFLIGWCWHVFKPVQRRPLLDHWIPLHCRNIGGRKNTPVRVFSPPSTQHFSLPLTAPFPVHVHVHVRVTVTVIVTATVTATPPPVPVRVTVTVIVTATVTATIACAAA